MPSTGTNESKTGSAITWDEAMDTWDESTGTWDSPGIMSNSDTQNAVTGAGNESKNSDLTGTGNESQN